MNSSLHYFMASLFFVCGLHTKAQTLSFTISSVSGQYAITCANPTLNLSANSSYTTGPVTYSWISSSAVLSGTSVALTTPGQYTVIASASSTLSATQTIAVNVNTAIPTSIVSPSYQSINCASIPQAVTLTATSPTVNVSNKITGPLGGTVISNNSSLIYQSSAIGEYTCLTMNDANGCSTVKTFTIQSTQGFPTFFTPLTSSPANFTLGCSTKSVLAVNIMGAGTTTIDINTGTQVYVGGPVSYTFLPPGASTVLPPGPGPGPSTPTANIPGTWTVVVKDNSNGCVTRVPISVISNTAPPFIEATVPTTVLTCAYPLAQVQFTSSVPTASYMWSHPTGTVAGNTFLAYSMPTQPTNSFVATYTLIATNTNNLCKSSALLSMYQNFYPPNAQINSLSLLLCDTPTLTLSNGSSSGIPAVFPHALPVVGFLWEGPAPQTPQQNSTTYLASNLGVYTLTAKDLNNGCTSQATTMISGCVSIQEFSANKFLNSILIQPNPGSEQIVIVLNLDGDSNIQCDLLNKLGQKVKTILPLSRQNAGEVKIVSSLDGLEPGLYFVQVNSGTQYMRSKLLITN